MQNVAEQGGRTSSYAYDSVFRLVNEAISGNLIAAQNGTLSYVLDPVANRLTLTSSLAAVPLQSNTFDANDQLVVETYDANGNTLTGGSPRSSMNLKTASPS